MASNKYSVALLGSVTAAAMMAAGPVLADEVSDLKAQIEALSQKVQQIETQKAQPAPIPANVVTGGDFPGSFKMPGSNTSIKLGGYAKLDINYDFDQKGSDQAGGATEDSLTTPVDQNTGHIQFSVRQTRFNFDSRTTSEDMGTVRGFLEVDLNQSTGATETISNSHNLRLRHAFVTIGPWLMGQTWSTFIDPGSYADTIDFGGPAGETFIRQAQVRYTQKFGATQIQLAAENPQPVISGGGVTSGERDRVPDFVGLIKTGGDWGFLSVTGLTTYITGECGGAGGAACTDDTALGWGLGLRGRFNLMGKDNLKFQVNGGDGIGRYLLDATGSGSAVYDVANDKLDLVPAIGAYVAYQHHWNPKWRSNLVIGGTKINNPGQAAGTANENQVSLHFNTIWNATKKTNIGLEYRFLQSTNENGDSGTVSRLQFGATHSF